MTTVSTPGNLSVSDQDSYDDLTKIAGIGACFQRMLREEFESRTYQRLADLSPGEVARLKDRVGPLHCAKVDAWITKAREFASITPHQAQQVEGSTEPATSEQTQPSTAADEAKLTDVFIVLRKAFEVEGRVAREQLSIEHIEADEDENWMDRVTGNGLSVVSGKQLYPWMKARIRKKVQPSEPERDSSTQAQFSATASFERMAVRLGIVQIRAFQPPESGTPIGKSQEGRDFEGYIRSGEPFALQAQLELVGADRAQLASERRHCQVQFYARHLPFGRPIHLGDSPIQDLVPDRYFYVATLQKAALPAGLYRLQIVAMVHVRPPIVCHVEVPQLQVVDFPARFREVPGITHIMRSGTVMM